MKKTLGLGLLSLLAVGAAGAALVSGPVFNAGAADVTAFEFSKPSSNSYSVTEGFTFTYAASTGSSGTPATYFYQDGGSTGNTRYVQVARSNSGLLWDGSIVPSSLTLNAKVGGGSAKDLSNPVYATLVDTTGALITESQLTVTSKVTTPLGDDYVLTWTSVPGNAAGVRISHVKEASYNVRYISFSMSYFIDESSLVSYSIDTSMIENAVVTGASTVYKGGSATLNIAPNEGYKLPATADDFMIQGAVIDSYDSTTGELVISSVTDDVLIAAILPDAEIYEITTNLTGLTASGDDMMYENGTATVTLSVVDESTGLPVSVDVTGAVSYTYDVTTGIVTIDGATGTVTITAAAGVKILQNVSAFDFSTSGSKDLWTSGTSGYSRTVDLIEVVWSGSNAGNYFGPARMYAGNVITISALEGSGVKEITEVKFTGISGDYLTRLHNDGEVTITSPSGTSFVPERTSDSDNGTETFDFTGSGVTALTIENGNSSQVRFSWIEVTYLAEDANVALESISATCADVLVSQTVVPSVSFYPVNASNRNVSYSIVSGSEFAEIAEDGTITGLGQGTVSVKITPEDTNAAPITIQVNVIGLDIYGLEVGKTYALTSLGGAELSLSSNGSLTGTAFTGTPANLLPVLIENGLYAGTVAFSVEVDGVKNYINYPNNASSQNQINLSTSKTRSSSWICNQNSEGELEVRNVEVYNRYLAQYTSGNTLSFGYYQNVSGSGYYGLKFIEIATEMSDEEAVQHFVDLYLHMSDYTENLGWCNDLAHGYYLTAKKGFNQLTDAQRSLFQASDTFADARARYETWAKFNNDGAPYDGYDGVQTPIQSSVDLFSSERTVDYVVYGTFLLTAVAAVGFLVYRRRRQA